MFPPDVSPERRAQIERNALALRQHLVRWDPLDTIEMGGPEDEYDSWFPHLLALVQGGSGAAAIAEYLDEWLGEFGPAKMPTKEFAGILSDACRDGVLENSQAADTAYSAYEIGGTPSDTP